MAKGHTNPRPLEAPNKKSWNNTTGPVSAGGHRGPAGGKAGKHHNIVNTLAARRMNGIGRMSGGGEKM